MSGWEKREGKNKKSYVAFREKKNVEDMHGKK